MKATNAGARDSSVLELIRERRSVRDFKPESVPRDAVERWLEAARWAPNHRLTEPWRFFVLSADGQARAEVARLYREHTFEINSALPDAKRASVADANRQEALDAPLLVFAYSVPGDNEEVTRENYAAVACAIQNFQLAAWAEGYAAGWSTGGITRHPGLPGALGADPSWDLVGALFVGRPATAPRAQRAAAVDDCTRWL